MKENACSFTGHRVIAKAILPALSVKLKNEIVNLINKGFTEFIAGGALGFDTLVAKTVLLLKKEYPDIKLHLILPCPDQDKLWRSADKEIYRNILKEADEVDYLYPEYKDGCMLDRNRAMIEHSSVLIAYYDGRARSGTAMTVSYAKKRGMTVINLY